MLRGKVWVSSGNNLRSADRYGNIPVSYYFSSFCCEQSIPWYFNSEFCTLKQDICRGFARGFAPCIDLTKVGHVKNFGI